MKVYLVCVLDDKHYRDPDFYFFKTAFEAHKWIIDSLVSITEESMEEVTSNLDYRNVDGSDDQIMRIDYSYGDGEFYVNTIHEIEIKRWRLPLHLSSCLRWCWILCREDWHFGRM